MFLKPSRNSKLLIARGELSSLISDTSFEGTVKLHTLYIKGDLSPLFYKCIPDGLHGCAQGRKFHCEQHPIFSEGACSREIDHESYGASVWEHMLCVRDKVPAQFAAFCQSDRLKGMPSSFMESLHAHEDVFYWAAMLHDIGKIETRGEYRLETHTYGRSAQTHLVGFYPFPGHESKGACSIGVNNALNMFSDTFDERLRASKVNLLFHLIRHHGDTHDAIPNHIQMFSAGKLSPSERNRIEAYITDDPLYISSLIIFHHCDRLAIEQADGENLSDNERFLWEAYRKCSGRFWQFLPSQQYR